MLPVMKRTFYTTFEDKESGYEANIISLKDDGYTLHQIRMMTKHHNHNIRKWIHGHNQKGIDDGTSKMYNYKQYV
jgi:hypothetical protein